MIKIQIVTKIKMAELKGADNVEAAIEELERTLNEKIKAHVKDARQTLDENEALSQWLDEYERQDKFSISKQARRRRMSPTPISYESE